MQARGVDMLVRGSTSGGVVARRGVGATEMCDDEGIGESEKEEEEKEKEKEREAQRRQQRQQYTREDDDRGRGEKGRRI